MCFQFIFSPQVRSFCGEKQSLGHLMQRGEVGAAGKKGGGMIEGGVAGKTSVQSVCVYECVRLRPSPFSSLHLTEAKANKMLAELKTQNYKTERELWFKKKG